MKKLLIILPCLPMIGFGQNVNIPDANFKVYLAGDTLINTNGDSEIQLSEANLFGGTIDCESMNISDLTGIQTRAQISPCDSVGYTIVSGFGGTLQLNGTITSGFSGSITSWDWTVCDEAFCFSDSGPTGVFTQFTINDTLKVCLSTNINYMGATYSCMQCDSLVYDVVNGWILLNMGNPSFIVFDCADSLEVTDVIIDNANLTMNIAIYNGYNSFISYPFVALTIDANGDTIQGGNISFFGANSLDTTWYYYSILSNTNPVYPLTMYFVYQYSTGAFVGDTCILTYNPTSTAITDINIIRDRKLINIIDVLGKESTSRRNIPLFYIYDDGTVEKKIILE